MGKIIAITNQKGGVGKTTSSINIAASLAFSRRRVLLVDLDPQGNATTGSGIDKHCLEYSIYEVLTDKCDLQDVIQPTADAGYVILPANSDLTAAEVWLMSIKNKESKLSTIFSTVKNEYDYIIIDCPPSLNILTLNAMVAASSVLIPVQCEYYALEGLAALNTTINNIKKTLNPALKIEGILRTMYDARNSLTLDVSKQLISHYGDKVYRAVIPRNVRLAEAPSYGMPILKYDRHSRGAISYLALVAEFIRRNEAITIPESTNSPNQATKELTEK